MILRKFSFSWKSNVVPLESNLCVLSPKSCIVIIRMNTRSSAARRTEKFIAIAGAQENQVPPLEEVAIGDKVPISPPPMMDGDIKATFLQMSQAITTQEQAVTT